MTVCSLQQSNSNGVVNVCFMVLQVSFEMDYALQAPLLHSKQLFLMLKVS